MFVVFGAFALGYGLFMVPRVGQLTGRAEKFLAASGAWSLFVANGSSPLCRC
jgi:hypothetical protein